jgi:methyl-accepting chemotaxis protein
VPKISYVKLVPEWGWMVGSGIYIDDVGKEINQILLVIGIVVGGIAAGCLFLAYLMARSISRPITKVIEGLTEGADQVASGASQVSSASQSLARGASEQAAGLEETSASMEEMSSMTKQNAGNAQTAKAMTSEAGQVVENVNHHMEKMGEAIAQITKSSEETGKIIKTIDEIAFQTNLLALNAAVEAARAGEAGAGFAVVADEVRNLAMRASEAAKNTSHLIESTIKSIKAGNELTLATREAFQKNVEISKKISRLIDEIAAASQEQSQGIDQVSKAVAEMDKVVQQNAANAEESAAAAEEMNSQAEQMKGYMGELEMIVGGKGKDNRRGSIHHQPKETGKKILPVRLESAPSKGKLPRKASPPDQKSKGEKSPDPRQVLPLEEGDFKSF